MLLFHLDLQVGDGAADGQLDLPDHLVNLDVDLEWRVLPVLVTPLVG